MSLALRIIMDVCMAFGCFFALAGTIGILRMPDVFCRMQSSTNIATFGVLGALIGALIYAIACVGSATMIIKIITIAFLIILTNPIANHEICRGSYKYGLRPDDEMVCDEYGKDDPNDD